MSLVTLREVLAFAQERKSAIPAFTVDTLEVAEEIAAAAEDANYPAILMIGQNTFKYGKLSHMANICKDVAASVRVPLVLHLDHGKDYEQVIACLRNGFTSVMFDGSKLPLERNIAVTKEVSRAAHAVGVDVEAELGAIGGTEDGQTATANLVDVDEARKFLEQVEIDALAIGIGNAHGYYKGKPDIKLDVLRRVREFTDIPLVLHGCTGMDEAVIREAISDICVSMKAEDYLTLPDYTEDIVPVVLDPKAKRAYDKLERDMLLQVDEATITAQSAAVLNGKLLQLCSGAVYDEDGQAVEVHTCKLEAFLEVVEQLHGKHALVFYWFQHERARLAEALKGSGLRVRMYRGAEDAGAWNAGEVDLLLAHPASCGYGLNLQAGGHHIVWYGYPNWALELYQQANARLHRQGQRYPVIAHHLVVQGGMDAAVVAALHDKGDTQEALMQALKARIQKARTA